MSLSLAVFSKNVHADIETTGVKMHGRQPSTCNNVRLDRCETRGKLYLDLQRCVVVCLDRADRLLHPVCFERAIPESRDLHPTSADYDISSLAVSRKCREKNFKDRNVLATILLRGRGGGSPKRLEGVLVGHGSMANARQAFRNRHTGLATRLVLIG